MGESQIPNTPQKKARCYECRERLELKNMKERRRRDRLTGRERTFMICKECIEDEAFFMVECNECSAFVNPEDMEEVTNRDCFTGNETSHMLCSECRTHRCTSCGNYVQEDNLSECEGCGDFVCESCEDDGICCRWNSTARTTSDALE